MYASVRKIKTVTVNVRPIEMIGLGGYFEFLEWNNAPTLKRKCITV